MIFVRKIPILITMSESYQDGYQTGLSWDNPWTPGGPWVYTGPDKELHERSLQEHRDWLQGWKDGVHEKRMRDEDDTNRA